MKFWKIPVITVFLILCNLPPAISQVETESIPSARPTVGIALGGGGTRGYAHIGVLRVLKMNGVPIDMIVGTSMGAVVGGLLCSGLTCKEIEKILMSKAFWDASELLVDKLDLVVLPIAVLPRTLVKKSYSGLYKGNKLANFINSKLPSNRRTIEQLPVKFGAVSFNLLDGKTNVITSGDLGRALQASSAVPELRQPVSWQEMLLVDGGVTDNLPCRKARNLGADFLIGVNVDERLDPVDDKAFLGIGSVSNRCITANLQKLDREEEQVADIIIHPEVSGINLLSGRRVDMEKAIRAGEQAAVEAIPRILDALQERNIHTLTPRSNSY
ncbi:MAG: patatin-like phospholipase family protein [Cyanobacteria bacterium]|nr:patatin-like phospholipase family protein [Cyanobacteriota bacterium]